MSKHDWIPPVLIVGVALSLVATGTSQDSPKIDLDASVRSLMTETLERSSIEAVAVAVSIGSDTLFAGGLGPARPGKSAQATANTRFDAAPLAHALLVTAALQLEAAGKLGYEDRVALHLPKLVAEGCPVRVTELLAHTSGLPDYRDFAPAKLTSEGRPTYAQLAGLVLGKTPETAPGECVKLSATDTLLLAALLEQVTGKPAEEVLSASIFEKLGMQDTLYDLGTEVAGTREAASKEGANSPAFLPRGLSSSAADLLRFQRGLVDLSLLDSDDLETMNAPLRLVDGSRAASGLGVRRIQLHETAGLVLAEGVRGGAHLVYYPEFDLAIAVMARGRDAEPERLARAVARLVIVEPEVGKQDIPLTEGGMRPYVGSYQIGCTTVVIRGALGHIVLDEIDESPRVLLFQGEHSFVARDDPDVWLVFEVEGERALSFLLEKRGTHSRAVRLGSDSRSDAD
jgi:CubicO group peptidase (beta-lactamase class C family)